MATHRPQRTISRRALVGGAAAGAAALTGTRAGFAAPALIQSKKKLPLFTTENDPATLDFYKNTMKAFQEQVASDVELEITIYQDENQLQYLTTAFQTGTDLGIFAPPGAYVSTWSAQDRLLPLTKMVQEIGEKDFLPGTRVVVDGQDYAMPFQSNASALWCRVDLLEEAGMKPPKTFEDYLAAAKELNGKNGIVGVSSGVGSVPQLTLQYFTPYVYQSGWSYFDLDGTLRFDEPDVLEAVKRFTDLMRNTSPSLYNATYPDILNTYIAGRAVFGTFPGRLGVNLAAKAPDLAEKTTVVPVPAGPFMTADLFFGGIQQYAIYSKTAYPDEARAFLKFMTTGDRALAFSMTVPGHLLPPLESVRKLVPTYKSDFMSKYGDWVITMNNMVPHAFGPDLSMGAVHDHTFNGRIANPCPWASAIWTSPPVDGQMFQEILIKNEDPEKAWTKASDTMHAAGEKWRSENPDWKPAFTG